MSNLAASELTRRIFLAALLWVVLGAQSFDALAIVDMKSGNYNRKNVDLRLDATGEALEISRDYNSTTLFSGMFGFGWCSDMETSVQTTPEGWRTVQVCGAGQEYVFKSSKGESAALEKSVGSIVEYYKKNNPGASEKTLATLRDQLRSVTDLRQEWAQHIGLKQPAPQKGEVFISEALKMDRLIFQDNGYVRTLGDGRIEKFDSEGHLTARIDAMGNATRLVWKGGLLRELVDPQGRKLTFEYSGPTKRVTKIKGPNNIEVVYTYDGELLRNVVNMWKRKHSFEYDDRRNLTKYTDPNGFQIILTYHPKNDWVVSYTEKPPKGTSCTEVYNYDVDSKNPEDVFWSTAVKKCGTEVVNEARFDFLMGKRPDGQKYLAQVKTHSMTGDSEVTYHPQFGTPVTRRKDGKALSYAYYDSGLLKEKTTKDTRTLFNYDKTCNKVSHALAEFYDDKGKVVRKRESDFIYDGKCRMKSAKNTDGQSIVLRYDAKGRIEYMVDHARKEVVLRYDERTNKPKEVSRPKVGAMTVTYKANGDVDQVSSPEGPIVPAQVASTLNNFLDVIAPATTELSL